MSAQFVVLMYQVQQSVLCPSSTVILSCLPGPARHTTQMMKLVVSNFEMPMTWYLRCYLVKIASKIWPLASSVSLPLLTGSSMKKTTVTRLMVMSWIHRQEQTTKHLLILPLLPPFSPPLSLPFFPPLFPPFFLLLPPPFHKEYLLSLLLQIHRSFLAASDSYLIPL